MLLSSCICLIYTLSPNQTLSSKPQTLILKGVAECSESWYQQVKQVAKLEEKQQVYML